MTALPPISMLDPTALSPSDATPSCPQNNDICNFVYEKTQQVWLAESSYWLLVKPLRILLIILLAIIVRFLAHRMIIRIIKHTVDSTTGIVPAPLRAAVEVLPSDRKRQRAEALGSVMRSVASTVVLTVAAMMILAELGVNLGPILASAGIAGIAIGFGAQSLVKDFLAGMFILFEDQFGVGDGVELGQSGGTVLGTVEAVGLRITTVRDELGMVWYIRNGEIVRVGNQSQGWSRVVVDVQSSFSQVAETTRILRETAQALANDPEWRDRFISVPTVLGVEEITSDATILRTTAKTSFEHQQHLAREMRQRVIDALGAIGGDRDAKSSISISEPDKKL